MRNKIFSEIKERMLDRSMELWGIKDTASIDPILELLIDVFAYEKAKLHQEIEVSDSQLLHRLSRILVSNKWSLPSPAHGLLNVYPTEEYCQLTAKDHFYVNRSQFGKNTTSIYFTSLIDTEIINAAVKCKVFKNEISYYEDKYGTQSTFLNEDSAIEDYTCWVGIGLSEEVLERTKNLSLCVLLEDLSLYPYLNTLSIHDGKEKQLSYHKGLSYKKEASEAHYFEDVMSYYSDYFYTIGLARAQELKSIEEQFPKGKKDIEGVNYEEKLLWLKITLPEVFSSAKIEAMKFAVNTIPIVNRKNIYVQHNFITNGKIASLPSEMENYFLNVKEVYDDKGNLLKNALKSNESSLEGTYSLYFGDIERFDSRSAKVLVDKVAHLIREEGNAFAAMNPEKLNKYLHGIVERLEEIEEKSIEKLKHINISNERAFLLTYPYENTTNYEIEYWLSNAELGNGFDDSFEFGQYGTNLFDVKKVKLLTKTIGGKTRRGEREQIDSLRYGLLTRERIVSTKDVESFMKQQIGAHIKHITVKPGMMISPEKKKGIVRTVEVVVELKELFLSTLNLQRLSAFLEKELTQKSIGNTPYKVILK
ncbi:hypothetical protein [Tenacibaculum maritimum]|uniref:hypothetical protein n=1 Tax=Tenacibaculum maritimum TaxID=107401 RepID=UPI00230702B5|nr:hypothetical protein [Tenacibaculum maritimum]MDB0601928.1 hypothetical protein [Tenacibaculum maritimum]MDB0613274.1 hypothetical protein [Tenacibaculum maritimum]